MGTKYGAKYVFWHKLSECVVSAEWAEGLRSGKQRQLPEYIRRLIRLTTRVQSLS